MTQIDHKLSNLTILTKNNPEVTMNFTGVMDFTATWCGPCKSQYPIIEEVATLMPNIKFLKVDIDENEDFAIEYRIMAVPTLLFMVNGVVEKRRSGLVNKKRLIRFIKKYIER